MSDLEKAREFFGGDLYATSATGIVIVEVGDHFARCSLQIERKHQNAYGGVMGGVICTLADFTFAICSNFNQPHTVSLNCNITFLGMAKGKKLLSASRQIKDGRSTCTYEIDITDELGTKVALATFTGMKLEKK